MQSTAWIDESSPNNLADVYALYSRDNERLDKSKRDTFVVGTMDDVHKDFQVCGHRALSLLAF